MRRATWAFMRGSRLLYEQTGKAEFLQYMKDSAGYEFLCAMATRPTRSTPR